MKTNRLITIEECPWIPRDLPKGTPVFKYDKCTYGCIGIGNGIAVSLTGDDEDPFLELPHSSIDK